jgi:DeoR family fructose operon transcriptional repressor
VTVAKLAERFEVSADTIRRDLDQLDADGVLVRTHGGAVSIAANQRPDTDLVVRLRLNTAAKEVIGELAAELVDDDSVIIVNGGTTTLAVVRHLRNHRGLTIATNNLRVPAEISPKAFRDLYIFGGAVRSITQATTGPVTFQVGPGGTDVDIRSDLALLGVGAVSASGGYSTSNLGDAAMMAEMIDHAARVAILADSTKFDRRMFAQVATLEGADYLVTDAAPGPALSAALVNAGVEVITPETPYRGPSAATPRYEGINVQPDAPAET